MNFLEWVGCCTLFFLGVVFIVGVLNILHRRSGKEEDVEAK